MLNCSNDIDNFFEKSFKYLRVPVRDVPEANLIKHWQDTYDFIKDCKQRGGKVGSFPVRIIFNSIRASFKFYTYCNCVSRLPITFY